MKKALLLTVLIFIALISFSQSTIEDFPTVKGRYFGQKAPASVPEIFAPKIISFDDKSSGCSAFNANGTMFVFKRANSAEPGIIYITELKKGSWTKPYKAPFDSEYQDGDFTLSPDGKKLFMSSRRPTQKNGEALTESNIWVVDYNKGRWGEPVLLNSPVNSDKHESYASVASNGNLYFFARDRGGYGQSDMFVSKMQDGAYNSIINMGSTFNTSAHEWDPFIASDESYLIFCSTKEGGYGRDDLYISFRKKDYSWTEPVNMGECFNSAESENRPYVTLDERFLFFTSIKTGKRHIYWVKAEVLEDFKPDYLKEY